MTENNNELAIFQTKDGAIQLRQDVKKETIWASQADLILLYGKDQSVISRHIKNIFKDGEVDKKSNMQKMHNPNSDKPVEFYSLDIILAVGYRTNSSTAIQFRQWATRTLKQHIVDGFTINSSRIQQNHQAFLEAVENIRLLTKNNSVVDTDQVLELIKSFSYTWFSLDSYDKDSFPKQGSKQSVQLTASEFLADLKSLKTDLIQKGQAAEIFAQEREKGNLQGIFGNVFQAVFGEEVYETLEQKSAHLLYFIIKNHPFIDGNKRSGAFAFIWFLQKIGYNFRSKINPETLATLTILIAESKPEDKDKMIGIILLILNFKQ